MTPEQKRWMAEAYKIAKEGTKGDVKPALDAAFKALAASVEAPTSAPMIHDLKIGAGYYHSVLDGSKPFELRKNDRDYRVGDLIHFKPVMADGRVIGDFDDRLWLITYVLEHRPDYGLMDGYCVLGIAATSLRCLLPSVRLIGGRP